VDLDWLNNLIAADNVRVFKDLELHPTYNHYFTKFDYGVFGIS
jgi:hypothetical protein